MIFFLCRKDKKNKFHYWNCGAIVTKSKIHSTGFRTGLRRLMLRAEIKNVTKMLLEPRRKKIHMWLKIWQYFGLSVIEWKIGSIYHKLVILLRKSPGKILEVQPDFFWLHMIKWRGERGAEK